MLMPAQVLVLESQVLDNNTANKKPQLWLRNPLDMIAFEIHPEESHRNEHSCVYYGYIQPQHSLEFGI